MYYKIVDDRMVFDPCRTIRTEDGVWISNPTEEQIAEAGWLPFVPPEVDPPKITEPGYAEIAEAIKKMLASTAEELSDEEALEVAAVFPTWISKMGLQVNVGERYWFDGKLYKVVQAHTVQEGWTPDITPALFTEVSIAEIPEWKAPTGAQDAYNKGDKVKHNDKTWESNVDANVWEPGAVGTESLWSEIA